MWTARLRHTPRGPAAALAVALLAVELLAGVQAYLSQTVLPLVADELGGRSLYGAVGVAGQATLFLTLPLGGWLLTRYRVGPLLLWGTALSALGSVLCALAPTMLVFVVGTGVRGLAAGALATVSMGAVSRGLPPRLRQLVLGGMAGTWVLSSLAGPIYAGWVSATLGWRWAMVLYLPVLVLVRLLVIRSLPPRHEGATPTTAPLTWSLVLALGAVVLAVPAGRWSLLLVVVGTALLILAARRLLPDGTLTAIPGRPAALAALAVVSGAYFGSTSILAVVAHDAFGLSAAALGTVIAAPAFVWAWVGLWCGAHPAASRRTFRRRSHGAAISLAAGVVTLTLTVHLAPSAGAALVGLGAGAAACGLGMGLVYADLLGVCLTEAPDGITGDAAAAAVVLAEVIGTALTTTVALTWLGTGFGLVEDVRARAGAVHPVLFVVVLALPVLLRRAAAAVDHPGAGRASRLNPPARSGGRSPRPGCPRPRARGRGTVRAR